MVSRILITGISGQDGSYLASQLCATGVEVHGIVRRSSALSRIRLDNLGNDHLRLHYGDVTDALRVLELVRDLRPKAIYHLAAQSHVGISFTEPHEALIPTAEAGINILEAVRQVDQDIRVFLAISGDIFGNCDVPADETRRPMPQSPYAVGKTMLWDLGRLYREAHGMFVTNGILFSHESPRRGENFVTRKISLACARVNAGLPASLELGTLDARRDWGYAPEYTEAMIRLMALEAPVDAVLATGEDHSVQEFVEHAFALIGHDWREHVQHSVNYTRPLETMRLVGDAARAKELIGWTPSVRGLDLAEIMVAADLEAFKEP